METLNEYQTAAQIVDWAKASLNIIKQNCDLTNEDIKRIMRRIGECAKDTVYVDGDKPILGRIGIGLMLFITLMEFPLFYTWHNLSQWN